MEKVLGKIEKVSYGLGGYDDAMFGLSVTLSLRGGGTGVNDFKGWWTSYSEGAKYSQGEWEQVHLKTTLEIIELLTQAKKRTVSDLAGVPVEAEIDQNTLKSWRVLTEVL